MKFADSPGGHQEEKKGVKTSVTEARKRHPDSGFRGSGQVGRLDLQSQPACLGDRLDAWNFRLCLPRRTVLNIPKEEPDKATVEQLCSGNTFGFDSLLRGGPCGSDLNSGLPSLVASFDSPESSAFQSDGNARVENRIRSGL